MRSRVYNECLCCLLHSLDVTTVPFTLYSMQLLMTFLHAGDTGVDASTFNINDKTSTAHKTEVERKFVRSP